MADRAGTGTAGGGADAVPAGERLARRFRRLARSLRKAAGDARGGLRSFERAVRLRLKPRKEPSGPALLAPDDPADYQRWIAANDMLTDIDRGLIRRHIAGLASRPRFSILLAADPAGPAALDPTVASVLAQLYDDLELILAGSAAAPADPRVRVLAASADPASAFAAGLAAATGDWIVPLSPGDRLAGHALYLLAAAIAATPAAGIVYSDEDTVDAAGRRSNPWFKPDFDPDLVLAEDLFGRLAAYRADRVHAAGGLRPGFGEAAERDLALRILDADPDAPVVHVPFVLCHRPAAAGGGAPGDMLPAIADHFARTGEAATAELTTSGVIRIRRTVPAPPPAVSIVIPTKNRHDLLGPCLEGLTNRTDYRALEIVIVDNGSDEAEALALLDAARRRPNVKVVEDRGPFNFSRLVNRGVAASTGEIVVLLNNDIDVINPGWLAELVSHAVRPAVGAVGAMLYYADDTIQHAGVVLGINGRAGHEHKRVPRGAPGYRGRLRVLRETACVTGACLATRRSVYDALGGLNERDLAVGFNDVDYCIRVRLAGWRVLWTPHAELYHHESVSRGRATETAEGTARHLRESGYLRRQWGPLLQADPFYNPNFTLESVAFRLAPVSRARKPWIDNAAARAAVGPGATPDPAALDWRRSEGGPGAV